MNPAATPLITTNSCQKSVETSIHTTAAVSARTTAIAIRRNVWFLLVLGHMSNYVSLHGYPRMV